MKDEQVGSGRWVLGHQLGQVASCFDNDIARALCRYECYSAPQYIKREKSYLERN